MVRACVAVLLAAVLLAAVPAVAPAAYRDFRSPSGKLGCAFYSDGETPRFVRCEWPGSDDVAVTLGETGNGRRVTVTDTVRNPRAKVLAYRRSTRFGHLRCTSRRTGINCRSSRSDHGFTVSVDKQRVF
jgi:uncharacterized protein DUF6636